MYDFIVIGAGISGALITRELSKYQGSVLLLEKENDVGNHATIANSAIVHSGHDPEPNSLKAQLCVRGNALYEVLEKELNIPLLRTGAFVLAHDKEEEATLDMLYRRSKTNKVPDVHYLSIEEARTLEPNLSDSVTKVLSLPSTKVTYPWEVALSAVENAIMNGAEFRKNQTVTSIDYKDGIFVVKVNKDECLHARFVINASGAFADQVAAMLEQEVPYKITPRRGEYFVLDRRVKGFINRTLYPVPTDKGKGVLLVPQVHGNILIGPNSVFQDSKQDITNTKDGLNYVKEEASRLAKDIPYNQVIRTFTGIRATSTYKDFYISSSKAYPQFIHVAGIDSPGLTAAPAIAEYVVNDLIKKLTPLVRKTNFNPYREKIKMFHDMTPEEKKEAFKNEPRYGRLICKCEKVTEGDVIQHIHRIIPGDTVKGVKKRARAGSGICQGGYCEVDVIKLISKELNIPLKSVNYYHQDTPILLKETKVKK